MTGPVDPQYGGQHPGQPVAAVAGRARNGFGVTAVVLGLFALLLAWTVIGGIVLGILAVIFGVLGRRRVGRGEATNGGVSVAGIVLGGIGLVIAIVLLALALSVLNTPAGRGYRDCLQRSAGNPTLAERCVTEFTRQFR